MFTKINGLWDIAHITETYKIPAVYSRDMSYEKFLAETGIAIPPIGIDRNTLKMIFVFDDKYADIVLFPEQHFGTDPRSWVSDGKFFSRSNEGYPILFDWD